MQWQSHNSFISEYKKLSKRFSELDLSFEKAKKLLSKHFDPIEPQIVIEPGKLHRITTALDMGELWKLEMVVIRTRSSQSPRIWFNVNGYTITFLAIATHLDNYDDNKVTALALSRWSDFS
jgi:hypothetical protein